MIKSTCYTGLALFLVVLVVFEMTARVDAHFYPAYDKSSLKDESLKDYLKKFSQHSGRARFGKRTFSIDDLIDSYQVEPDEKLDFAQRHALINFGKLKSALDEDN